jgi:hypothetical protein
MHSLAVLMAVTQVSTSVHATVAPPADPLPLEEPVLLPLPPSTPVVVSSAHWTLQFASMQSPAVWSSARHEL